MSLKQLARLLQPAFERLLELLDARFTAFIQPRRLKGDIIVTAYTGWGTPEHLELTGRVLLPRTLPPPKRGDPRWRNFRSIVRRLLSRAVGGVTVRGTLEGLTVSAVSDADGFFTLVWERPGAPDPAQDGWLEAALHIQGRSKTVFAPVRVVGRPHFGIISDLDDTVLKSDVTSLPQMLGTVLTGNARTRLPFPGVSALYRGLVREQGGLNPIFYVSSSPWNFFDLLWTFLKYRRLPLGPIFLRNWGAELFSGNGHHKHGVIERLMQRYPALAFVLIGDSGEQDPEIYAEVVRRYPGRVLAVYIRKVSGPARDEGVHQLRVEVQKAGVELVLARDSLAAAAHAMALGLISPGELRSVIQSVAKSAPPTPFAAR
ncbi:phosphatase [Deinococcus irradiatisoli]|uniref:Phosphatase n=1 Tax=Deinococcus irradiatisoli TaxID=2202254 RepID=A0A2Z3JI65_9DEIO|nr:phosphatase [Deinococcus irradiatisoli]